MIVEQDSIDREERAVLMERKVRAIIGGRRMSNGYCVSGDDCSCGAECCCWVEPAPVAASLRWDNLRPISEAPRRIVPRYPMDDCQGERAEAEIDSIRVALHGGWVHFTGAEMETVLRALDRAREELSRQLLSQRDEIAAEDDISAQFRTAYWEAARREIAKRAASARWR